MTKIQWWLATGLVVILPGLYGYRQPAGIANLARQTAGNPQSIRLATDSIPARFNWGKPAQPAHIAALDIDIRPDGVGLPAGSGTATAGAVIFAAKCAACHGAGGIGGPSGSLVITTPEPGNQPNKPARPNVARVIGNYWPYATTVFDYVRRAMPFNQPGSLTNDEVYALTAYLLTANKILDEKTLLNAQTLPRVSMPAQKLFVPDDRKGGPEVR